MEELNFNTITNDEYKKLDNFQITYGIGDTNQFGKYLLATTNDNKEICHISLFDDGKENSAIDNLQADWPLATLQENSKVITPIAERVFAEKANVKENVKNTKNIKAGKAKGFSVLLRGTELQCNVWKELTKVSVGSTANYEQIAKAVGNPRAIRAVASAIAKNKLAYLVPCHRVIRKTGAPNKYRWGPQRKVDILRAEAEKL